MAHPYNDVRQSKVERSRVGRLTRGYAADDTVLSAVDEGTIKESRGNRLPATSGAAVQGRTPKVRLDRPGRASGGRVGSKGATVNVIVQAKGDQPPGPPPLGMMPPPPMPPPGPPPIPGPPPGGPPMGMPPGGPPPGIRSSGGRAFAKGGRITSGPAWDDGLREGTQVSHSGNKNDGKDIGRGKPITYAKGGPVEAPKNGMGPKFGGGGLGGRGRMQKAARAKAKR